jgi:predicted NBD/HSP70 family sugar kinase
MYVLIDVGGTNIRVSTIEHADSIGEPRMFSTPRDPEEAVAYIQSVIDEDRKGREVSHIVMGLPGIIDAEGVLYKAPNLSTWEGFPIKRRLAEYFHAQVHIENDAALVGLGEAVYGAGKNGMIVGYLTISTGVGGVRIVGKQIDTATFTFEPGKMIRAKRTIESLISGTAFRSRFHTHPKNVRSPKVWELEAEEVAEFVATASAFWSPDTIVLGGSMMKDIPLTRVEKYMSEYLSYLPRPPKLYRGTLGDFGGVHGALAYLRTTLKLR